MIKYYKLTKINKSLQENLMILQQKMSYDFEKDSQYLRYMISYKCNIYTRMILTTQAKLRTSKLINDKEMEEAVSTITKDVLSNLTKEYRTVLSKYFNNETLNIYVTEIIFDIISKFCTENNKSGLTKVLNRTNEVIEKNTISRSDI
jgi:predicted transcriptional regulator